MYQSPALERQLTLFLVMIFAATACGKSQAKQGDAPEALLRGASKAEAQAVPKIQAVPKEIETLAINLLQKYCGQRTNPTMECRDYKLKADDMFPSHAVEVTDADHANGIEDKWCVSLSYVKKEGPSVEPIAGLMPKDYPVTPGTDWRDASFTGLYTKRSGAWQYEQNGMCM